MPSFILECDKNLSYEADLIKKLDQDSSRILKFFELENLKQPKKIKIWTDRKNCN